MDLITFGDTNTFAFQIKDVKNKEFKIRLIYQNSIFIPFQKKEKYLLFIKTLNKKISEIKANKLMDEDFSLFKEVDIAKWVMITEIDQHVSPININELFSYRHKYSFFLGTRDNKSLFIYQLSNEELGLTMMDYKRDLAMNELEDINENNYIFNSCKIKTDLFIKTSYEVIDFLEKAEID